MSRSFFSKAYEEIANIEPMEMTFTVEDADLEKLHDVLKDINVRECPWFEVQDKHGNKAKYYREPQWIPCSEKLPEEKKEVLISADGDLYIAEYEIDHGKGYWSEVIEYRNVTDVDAWMPLPEPYGGEQE